ncbi:DUF302 domain-containing protein [Sulfurisphaera tokodaii]|uniref:DUF302 domain-containing protein n=2 Tax=Sulfurisphaera tokodaii TaxID=111955 RepID=Q96ZL9_SULTO|nr:DUF302 domain-containing protein [Sulfurisphaera tokodaii]BAB66906.1 hypothetical protein STK_18150 [Sulfurisphaera tokodaii str. 7]HII73853.1 DUF302 domain-containing protein [Sulfurisphaera tokodaii]
MHIVKCKFSFNECEEKIKNEIKRLNAILFTEIDHKKNAEEVGLELNKCKVLYFGNPKVGTILMQKKIEISYDLPLRVSIWEKDGETYIAYKLPSEIAKEYSIESEVLKKMDEFIQTIISSVT